MLSRPSFVAALILLATPALAESEASTVRIDPRAYYGAVVTLEQGVRVWRPLPPTRHMIINPDDPTPLNLSLADVRETITSNNYVQAPPEAPAALVAPNADVYGVPGFFPGRNFHNRRHLRGLHRGHGHHGHGGHH